MNNLISIIVPIYNVRPYLRKCIDSIIGQTYTALEIILVDDGSTDGCAQICDEYAQEDSRVKVIHKQNGGLVSARKAGMLAAAGAYIGYVDGDDWIEPDMYEQLLGAALRYDADVVICGRYENTKKYEKKKCQDIPEGYYDKISMRDKVYPAMIVNSDFGGITAYLWDKLYKRECIEKYQMAVDERITMGEDGAAVYPCLLYAESIYVMRECLYHYRRRNDSMSRKVENPGIERARFNVLYHSVGKALSRGRDIYDLSAQWQAYLLYLMAPRMYTVCRGIEDLDYLFPFPDVRKGSKVLICGMGEYGQRLYQYLKRTGFCNPVAAFDRNYEELEKQGIPVQNPENIPKYEYDHIVIACVDKNTKVGIYNDLILNCPKEKVHTTDDTLIKSDAVWEAFGMLPLAGACELLENGGT